MFVPLAQIRHVAVSQTWRHGAVLLVFFMNLTIKQNEN